MQKGFEEMTKDKGLNLSKFASEKMNRFKKNLGRGDTVDDHVKEIFDANDEDIKKRTVGEFRKPIRPTKPRDPDSVEVNGNINTEEEKFIKESRREFRRKSSKLAQKSLGDVDNSPKALN